MTDIDGKAARRTLLLCALFIVAGCAGQVGKSSVEPFSLRLERGACTEGCVAYTLTINSDRSVRYERAALENSGEVSGRDRMSEADFARLKSAIRASDFFSAQDPICNYLAEDRGSVELSVYLDEQARVASRAGGCVSPPPDPVLALAELVDELTESDQWTGAD